MEYLYLAFLVSMEDANRDSFPTSPWSTCSNDEVEEDHKALQVIKIHSLSCITHQEKIIRTRKHVKQCNLQLERILYFNDVDLVVTELAKRQNYIGSSILEAGGSTRQYGCSCPTVAAQFECSRTFQKHCTPLDTVLV
jgi:hypothetical protein